MTERGGGGRDTRSLVVGQGEINKISSPPLLPAGADGLGRRRPRRCRRVSLGSNQSVVRPHADPCLIAQGKGLAEDPFSRGHSREMPKRGKQSSEPFLSSYFLLLCVTSTIDICLISLGGGGRKNLVFQAPTYYRRAPWMDVFVLFAYLLLFSLECFRARHFLTAP